MIPARLPLSDAQRIRLRDDRLWSREMERARQLSLRKLHCPCSECKGGRRLLIRNVRDHLLQHGRHPECRLWRGPGERDSSDEDWEREVWGPDGNWRVRVDAQVNTRAMLENAFPAAADDKDLEDRVQEEVASAFEVADAVHEDCSVSSGLRSGDRDGVAEDIDEGAHDEPTAAAEDAEVAEEHLFDECDLQEAMR